MRTLLNAITLLTIHHRHLPLRCRSRADLKAPPRRRRLQ